MSALNLSHADDRWLPILTSHIVRGKHRRCVAQHTLTAVSLSLSEDRETQKTEKLKYFSS